MPGLLLLNRPDSFRTKKAFDHSRCRQEAQRKTSNSNTPRRHSASGRGQPPADLTHFFDDDADEYIDELIGIVFRQNMKSMEKYCRWLSKRYVQAFGKLHNGLVDTIFKYNNRDSKGRYIAAMAGTRGKRKPDPLYFILHWGALQQKWLISAPHHLSTDIPAYALTVFRFR